MCYHNFIILLQAFTHWEKVILQVVNCPSFGEKVTRLQTSNWWSGGALVAFHLWSRRPSARNFLDVLRSLSCEKLELRLSGSPDTNHWGLVLENNEHTRPPCIAKKYVSTLMSREHCYYRIIPVHWTPTLIVYIVIHDLGKVMIMACMHCT